MCCVFFGNVCGRKMKISFGERKLNGTKKKMIFGKKENEWKEMENDFRKN